MRKPVYQNSYGPITRKLPRRRFLVPLPSHLFPNLIHRLGRVILVAIFARSFPHLITLSPPIVGNRHYPTCRDVIVLHLRLYPFDRHQYVFGVFKNYRFKRGKSILRNWERPTNYDEIRPIDCCARYNYEKATNMMIRARAWPWM